MSREKTDVILKVVVKHFFIEKEVTSTLVMDSLYSGLKALEGQNKCKKGRVKLLDAEEMPAPIVGAEKDMFVLVDDFVTKEIQVDDKLVTLQLSYLNFLESFFPFTFCLCFMFECMKKLSTSVIFF